MVIFVVVGDVVIVDGDWIVVIVVHFDVIDGVVVIGCIILCWLRESFVGLAVHKNEIY